MAVCQMKTTTFLVREKRFNSLALLIIEEGLLSQFHVSHQIDRLGVSRFPDRD